MANVTMRQMLESGVHFGHQTHRWNPRMGQYIYGDRNGIHILDLTQTVPMLDAALNVIRETVAKGGRILFVGTKRQAQDAIREEAVRCGMFYVNHRWLGSARFIWPNLRTEAPTWLARRYWRSARAFDRPRHTDRPG